MTHDPHLDNIIDVTKGKAQLAEQLGSVIGSDKHYKEVSTLALIKHGGLICLFYLLRSTYGGF